MTERIGLFGGSFDPVHHAHRALAATALAGLQLDRVLWIPAGQPWQKSRPMTAAVHREAMVRLAIAGEPRFELEPCELRRGGPTYTLDTVKELQARWPAAQLVLLIGQDQYSRLNTWAGWQDLLQRVTLAVANRGAGRGAAAAAPGGAAADAGCVGHRHPPTGGTRRGHRPSGATGSGTLY
jgi:nicotinate-nucleotide adenylyltransferase